VKRHVTLSCRERMIVISASWYWPHGLSTGIVLATALIQSHAGCDAFSFPRFPIIPPSNNINVRGGCDDGGNGGGKFPGDTGFQLSDGDDNGNDDGVAFNLASLYWIAATSEEPNNYDTSDEEEGEHVSQSEEKNLMPTPTEILRGGSVASTKSSSNSKKSIGSSINDSLDSMQALLLEPFRLAGSENPFKKNGDDQALKKQQDLLVSTKVQSVSAPNSQLLTPDDVTQCAKDSNLIGGTLTPETLENTANRINRFYLEQGYVMNSVTGATLIPPSDGKESDGEGHVELKVREIKLARPRKRSSPPPVHIRFVEKIDNSEASDDDESVFSFKSESSSQSTSESQRYRTVSGRTRPSKILRMVKLVPGSHFQILPQLWSQLATFPGGAIFGGGNNQGRAAIFSTIHAVRPVPTSQENTVELEIIATENKPVSLEYGVTKSLYSDQWEGEFDLKHSNILGGGEVATLNVRKGKGSGDKEDSGLKNWKEGVVGGAVSWRMGIKDDYLAGTNAGYDLEVFRDYVGVKGNKASHQKADVDSKDETSVEIKSEVKEGAGEDNCPLRTGANMRLLLPRARRSSFSPNSVSARLERVDPLSKDDCAQCTTCMSTDIGPYHHELEVSSRPLRSTVSATASAGGKWDARDKSEKDGDDARKLPYATGTLTSQQIMSLSGETRSIPPVDLAMRHVVSMSSRHLPRHDAVLLGLSSRVRGYKYNYQQSSVIRQPQAIHEVEQKSMLQSLKQLVTGNDRDQYNPPIALSDSISGTMEVRIPFERVVRQPILGSGNFVLFGDWCVARAQQPPSLLLSKEGTDVYGKPFRHSSVGIGVRKVVQGIPLKIDACVTEHGSKRLFFGIGQSFEA